MNELERDKLTLELLMPYVNHLKNKMKDLEQKLQDENNFIAPYTAIFNGHEVPMYELHPVFDAAIDAGIEAGRLGRAINPDGIVVVFQIEVPKNI